MTGHRADQWYPRVRGVSTFVFTPRLTRSPIDGAWLLTHACRCLRTLLPLRVRRWGPVSRTAYEKTPGHALSVRNRFRKTHPLKTHGPGWQGSRAALNLLAWAYEIMEGLAERGDERCG